MFRVLGPGRLYLTLGLLVVLVVLSLPSGAQETEHMTIYGRSTVKAGDRSDAGDWAGTWFYVNKKRKMALWMRVEEDSPSFKLRVQEKGNNLTTDWDGQASYSAGGKQGNFSITVDQRDDKTISGSWVWTVGDQDVGRKETADFTMYRTGHGRQLVMRVENWRREHAGGTQRLALQLWTFRKASRRQALWGELPF